MIKPGGFLISKCVTLQTPSGDGVFTHDLSVNPLSVVLINLRPLNDTGTLANLTTYLGVAAALNRISIFFQGASIFSMRGEDAMALAYFRHGIITYQPQLDNTNNERRTVTIPILLGRNVLDPNSCFPASKRGELSIELDIDIADTGYDTMTYDIDTIEMMGAKPKEFERKTTLATTFGATGQQDLNLPVGNVLRGAFLWGTTGFAGASPAPTWGNLSVLVDNQEHLYNGIDWESIQMHHSLLGRQPPYYDSHKHIITTDGNAQTELATLAGPYNSGDEWDNYAFLDFDMNQDDAFSIDTKGVADVILRARAEAAEAVRCIAIEKMSV